MNRISPFLPDVDSSEADPSLDDECFLQFDGRILGPEGLQVNHFRHYDPTPGQWLNEDPIGYEAGSENLRPYVPRPE